MEIREYLTNKGVSPFNNWYKKLDKTLKVRVDARIQRIKVTSNLGDFKSVGHGVYELRFIMKTGLRLYYAKDGEDLILLLIGGNKSSQDKDILKAKDYWRDYKLRGNNYGK